MFEDITISSIYIFFMVFTRVGAAIAFLPGFGETYIPVRNRLMIAVAVSFLVSPVIFKMIPAMPESAIQLVLYLLGEATVGVFIGLTARVLISTMHTAGMIVAYQSGLAAALLFDPNQGGQGSIIGNFYSLLAVVLVLTLDLHHLALRGVADSYHLFVPGELVPLGDMAQFMTNTVAGAFSTALQLAAPQVVTGLIMFLGAGVIARLMPNMHIFFIMIPLQIYIGFAILSITVYAAMLWFMGYYENTFFMLLGF